MTVRRLGGILIEYKDQGVMFDPTRNVHKHPTFISHAHADHASAFKYPERQKYATKETCILLEAMGWKNLDNINLLRINDKIKLEDIEVKVHNSGHILGSVEYEVNTPEGTVLYTGDLGTEKTFTMEPAKSVNCDILIIETTFGSPIFSFPSRKDLALEIYNWAVNTVINGKIPTFKTDSIGNAQELISILNQYTNLPVITNKSTSKVTDVYRKHGYNLESLDIKTDEAQEILDDGKCALITSKGSKLNLKKLEVALVTGWATIMGRNRISFPLSDHPDYKELLRFIGKCNPKRVLTFHGGKITKDFHKHVRKTLGIPSSPLTNSIQTVHGLKISNEAKIKACGKQIIRTVRIPGFIYQLTWLVKEMERQGFTRDETEKSVDYLIDRGVLKGTREKMSLR